MDKVMFSSSNDEWETPQELFDKLNGIYHFTLDVCASSVNHKCQRYFSKDADGLIQDWGKEIVWCNPPYTHNKQTLFVKRCYEHALSGGTVVLLIPARTDTIRFHEYILNKASKIIFLRGRLRFGNAKNTAPFPSMIVVYNGISSISEVTNVIGE